MITLKDLLEDNVDWDEVEIDDEEFERLSTQLIIDFLKKHGPYERQQLLTSWNFDNGKEVLQWIAQQPDTDKGTILLLYWYMNPAFFKQYQDRQDCINQGASYLLEDFDLISTIEQNYLGGFYKNQVYAFAPKADPYNSGYDWTKENADVKGKVAIPDEMFIALEGQIIEPPSWQEGIPSELEPIMDKLCDAVSE